MGIAAPGRSTTARFARQFLSGLPVHAQATLAIRIAAVGLEFTCLLVLAHALPAGTYGVYVLMMSCVAIGAVPATFGFDRLLVREVAARQASGDWSLLKALLRRALRATIASSIFVALVLLAIAGWALPPQNAELATAMRFAAALIPVVALLRLRQAALQGFGHVVAGQLPESIVQPVLMIALTAAAAIVVQAPRTSGLVFGLQLAATTAALTFGVILLRRRLPKALTAAAPDDRAREWLGTGLAFMWLVAMSALHTNVDTILVGALAGPDDAGVYRVATQLAMFVGLPLTAVSIAMAPSISALHATGRHEELQRRLAGAARTIFVCAALVAIFVAFAGSRVLAAFGADFGVGYVPAMVLVVAYLFHSAMATSSYLLFMTSHERAATLAFMAGVAINVTANLLLTPQYGILGAAIATGISLCVVSFACACLAWRLTGVNATVFARAGQGDAT
jgi:O-antigen/teichoic acid export membrane protein